jgi:hypothetical protein
MTIDARNHIASTIQWHQQMREERAEQKRREAAELEEQLQRQRELEREEYDAKRRSLRSQFQMLSSQVALRGQIQEREKREERMTLANMRQMWMDEEARIREELAHPQALIGPGFRGHR